MMASYAEASCILIYNFLLKSAETITQELLINCIEFQASTAKEKITNTFPTKMTAIFFIIAVMGNHSRKNVAKIHGSTQNQ